MPQDLVLMFAYHFPPENVIGALRPYRFYKYLTRLGYRCHVFTAAHVSQLPDLDAERVPDPFVDEPRRGTGWQVERAIRKFFLPGVTGSQWSARAYRAALSFLDSNPGYRVTIFSTFPPIGTHFAGYWLARQRHLPWIADYRDPVGDNSIHDQLNRFQQDVFRRLEKIFVTSNDFAIANTDAAEANLKGKYPNHAARIQMISNGFDPEVRVGPLPLANPAIKVLAHVGELYGGRTVCPVLESIQRLIDRGRLSPRETLVRLVGPAVPGSTPDTEFMSKAVSQGWLTSDPERVAQDTAHQIIQTADYLLLIQNQSRLQVPAKLYEYIQIGRPILAFVQPESPVERILSQSGVPYRCFYPSMPPDRLDEVIFDFFQLDTSPVQASSWFEDRFNARSHAHKVAELIERVHRNEARQDARFGEEATATKARS